MQDPKLPEISVISLKRHQLYRLAGGGWQFPDFNQQLFKLSRYDKFERHFGRNTIQVLFVVRIFDLDIELRE